MIINLTSHIVNIVDEDHNQVAAIMPSGLQARITTQAIRLEEGHDSVPLYTTTVIGEAVVTDADGNETAFPPSVEGTLYIVSGLFRSHYDRADLWQPGTLVRNANGQVVGCVGLSR